MARKRKKETIFLSPSVARLTTTKFFFTVAREREIVAMTWGHFLHTTYYLIHLTRISKVALISLLAQYGRKSPQSWGEFFQSKFRQFKQKSCNDFLSKIFTRKDNQFSGWRCFATNSKGSFYRLAGNRMVLGIFGVGYFFFPFVESRTSSWYIPTLF